MTNHVMDERLLRTVFSTVPSGVVALCASVDGEYVGMAVSTFVPVSLDPPLVSVCVQNASRTWQRLQRAPRLGISVLGEGHDRVARSLAMKEGDRFAGVETVTAPDGAVFVAGTDLWMNARIDQTVTAGDHAIVVLEISEVTLHDDREPLVFHRSTFRRLERAS